QVLALEGNSLSGSLPEVSGGGWANLTQLTAEGNSLSGTLPSGLFGLGKLAGLDLSVNGGLNGTLHLGGNRLSGSLPSGLGSLGSLVTLALGSNSLSGTVPGSALASLSRLQ